MKRALISGITGQDGSYLAELLLEKGYVVHGLVRRASDENTGRIAHLLPQLTLHDGDLCDPPSLSAAVERAKPDEVYNLAAMSFVRSSFIMPRYAGEVNGLGVVSLLEAVRHLAPRARVYQASTSEMWGSAPPPQSEATPFHPRSPYGSAKVYAHHSVVNWREAYGLHASCGILCNHESPRRGPEFVTRKVTLAAARIRRDLEAGRRPAPLVLGNLDAERDWGFAGDYVRAMWLMLQQDRPDDYVIATGESHTVREWVRAVFAWHVADGCPTMSAWQEFVSAGNAEHMRPSEVPALRGDASKARRVLGWAPQVTFEELASMMAASDWRG